MGYNPWVTESDTTEQLPHTHTHTHVISNRQLDGHGWSTKECLSWRERLRKVLGIRAVMKPPEMAEIDQNGTDYTDKKKKKKNPVVIRPTNKKHRRAQGRTKKDQGKRNFPEMMLVSE